MSHHEDPFSNRDQADEDVEKQDDSDVDIHSHGDDSRPSRRKKEGADGAVDGDAREELKEWECYDKLGYSFPRWKKWGILSVIFAVQTSMNFNASF